MRRPCGGFFEVSLTSAPWRRSNLHGRNGWSTSHAGTGMNCGSAARWIWRRRRGKRAGLVSERRALFVYGFPQLEEDELLFLDRAAGGGKRPLFCRITNPLSFPGNLKAARFLERRGWSIQRAGPSPRTLGERTSAAFLEETPARRKAFKPTSYPHIEAEIRGILAQIKTLLLKGISPAQIALAASDPSLYSPVLVDAAWEYEMPVRVQHDVPLQQTRLGAWIAFFPGCGPGWSAL